MLTGHKTQTQTQTPSQTTGPLHKLQAPFTNYRPPSQTTGPLHKLQAPFTNYSPPSQTTGPLHKLQAPFTNYRPPSQTTGPLHKLHALFPCPLPSKPLLPALPTPGQQTGVVVARSMPLPSCAWLGCAPVPLSPCLTSTRTGVCGSSLLSASLPAVLGSVPLPQLCKAWLQPLPPTLQLMSVFTVSINAPCVTGLLVLPCLHDRYPIICAPSQGGCLADQGKNPPLIFIAREENQIR